MKNWLESVYSDGTRGFVTSPVPFLGEKVKIKLRFLEGAPVKDVLVRQMVNGAEHYTTMEFSYSEDGLAYYEAEIEINEPVVKYIFAITTDSNYYFYNQAGIFTYVPDYRHDFVLLADYPQPDWVKGAVFYQIFPERFCNGDPSNDVRTGEYEYLGRKPIRVEDWNEDPRTHKESFAMDFYGGDLKGIEDKIPYLKELGVTAIYLNPIFESYSTHKYDCVDYFHVDKHFGTDEALVELSKALHENDMKLVLDISINHTGCANAWTKDKKEFYFKKEDGSLLGWAGFSTLPVLDYRSEELRNLIYRNDDSVLKKWLKEPYNIDGWRFDVADVFARNGEVQLADEVWHEVCKAIRDVKKDAIIIGEHWADCAEYLQGDLWNTPMNYYGFGRIIRQFAGLPDLFLMRNEAFLKVDYEMSASDVINRTDSHYSSIPQVLADTQMNLFDSHDIARLHNHDSITFAKWKSAVLAQLLWTGIPCIYYGDELAIDGYTEHDSGFRYPMPWGKDDENSRLHFNLYSRMTKLRREIDAFSEGGRKVLFADGKVLAIARFMDDEKYVGIISMENEDRTIDIPVWTIGAKDAINESFGIDSEDLSFEAEAFSYNTDIEKMTEKVDAFGEHFMCGADNGILKINVPAFASYIFKVR